MYKHSGSVQEFGQLGACLGSAMQHEFDRTDGKTEGTAVWITASKKYPSKNLYRIRVEPQRTIVVVNL